MYFWAHLYILWIKWKKNCLCFSFTRSLCGSQYKKWNTHTRIVMKVRTFFLEFLLNFFLRRFSKLYCKAFLFSFSLSVASLIEFVMKKNWNSYLLLSSCFINVTFFVLDGLFLFFYSCREFWRGLKSFSILFKLHYGNFLSLSNANFWGMWGDPIVMG